MTRTHTIILACLLLLMSAKATPASQPAFHGMFTENMVLQRNEPIRLSGTATPHSHVTIQLGTMKRTSAADATGHWMVTFPPLPAGGPYTVTLSGMPPTKPITMNNVLIGDLWFCSGQSNMDMPLYSQNPYWQPQNALQERDHANYPQIRLFKVPHTQSLLKPRQDLTGGSWQLCSPQTAASFSALAYFYGRELHQTLNIPIGLIQASVSGSPIEPWLPMHTYLEHPEEFPNHIIKMNFVKNLFRDMDRDKKRGPYLKLADWLHQFDTHAPTAIQQATLWKATNYNDLGWKRATLPWRFPNRQDGVVWFRNTFQLPENMAGTPLELHLGKLNECDETYVNGQKVGEHTDRRYHHYPQKRTYQISPTLLRKGANVIAVRLSDFRSSGGFYAKPETITLRRMDNNKTFTLPDAWKLKPEFLVDEGQLPPMPGHLQRILQVVDSLDVASTLFNGMVHPWTRIPIRGVIWYQGCANCGNTDYYNMHQYLIRNWRKAWNIPNLPFLLVQLSAFGGGTPWHPKPDGFWKNQEPDSQSPWALTREIQAEMTKIPNVGMAVSIDRGEHSNIHPADKQTVARRLADTAKRMVYGMDVVSQGPTYSSMTIEQDNIRIAFKHAEHGLKTSDGKMPGCFAIAGKDGHFVWAQTKLDGNTVLVSSPHVPQPKAVRYGWVNYRDNLNLYNHEGFPAVPFRTDKPSYHPIPDFR